MLPSNARRLSSQRANLLIFLNVFLSAVHRAHGQFIGPYSTAGWDYVGCMSNSANGIFGPGNNNIGNGALTMNPSDCIASIASIPGNTLTWAGVDATSFCWAGSMLENPSVNTIVPEASCSIPCAGHATEQCGGNNFINVYRKTQAADANAPITGADELSYIASSTSAAAASQAMIAAAASTASASVSAATYAASLAMVSASTATAASMASSATSVSAAAVVASSSVSAAAAAASSSASAALANNCSSDSGSGSGSSGTISSPGPINCPEDDGAIYDSNGKSFQLICQEDNTGANLQTLLLVQSYAACGDACAENDNCEYFIFASPGPNDCYLKSSVGSAVGNTNLFGGLLLGSSAKVRRDLEQVCSSAASSSSSVLAGDSSSPSTSSSAGGVGNASTTTSSVGTMSGSDSGSDSGSGSAPLSSFANVPGWNYVGCVTDAPRQFTNLVRSPDPTPGASITPLNQEDCLSWAMTFDSTLFAAGVEDQTECWAGYGFATSLSAGDIKPAASCSMACPGDADEPCGGNYFINAFTFGPLPSFIVNAASTTSAGGAGGNVMSSSSSNTAVGGGGGGGGAAAGSSTVVVPSPTSSANAGGNGGAASSSSPGDAAPSSSLNGAGGVGASSGSSPSTMGGAVGASSGSSPSTMGAGSGPGFGNSAGTASNTVMSSAPSSAATPIMQQISVGESNTQVAGGSIQFSTDGDGNPISQIIPNTGSQNLSLSINVPDQSASAYQNSNGAPASSSFTFQLWMPSSNARKRQAVAPSTGCEVFALVGNQVLWSSNVNDLNNVPTSYSTGDFTPGPGQILVIQELCAPGVTPVSLNVGTITENITPPVSSSSSTMAGAGGAGSGFPSASTTISGNPSSLPVPNSLPTPPAGWAYYVTPDGQVWLIAQTTSYSFKKRQISTGNFQSCIEICDADPICSEAIFSLSSGFCSQTQFSCNNPHPPADSNIAILVGNLESSVSIPSCLFQASYLGYVAASTCSAQIITTTTVIATSTVTNCPSPLTCPQSFLWYSSGGSGLGMSSWSSSSASGVNSMTASISSQAAASSNLPQCPNEPAGRLFSGNLGQFYSLYCGMAYTGQVLATQSLESFAACINACDLYNIVYQSVGSPCRAVSFVEGQTENNCSLEGGSGILVLSSSNIEDSAILLEPPGPQNYANFLTYLPTLTIYQPGSTITLSNPTNPTWIGPSCPGSNNTVYTSSNGDVWWILCGSAGLTKRAAPKYNPIAQCIELCSLNPDCTYVDFDVLSSTCTQETYDCQSPDLHGVGAILVYQEAASIVRLPYCANGFVPSKITESLPTHDSSTSTSMSPGGDALGGNDATSLAISYSDYGVGTTSVAFETSVALSTIVSAVSTVISGNPTIITTTISTLVTITSIVSIPETITLSVPVTYTEVLVSSLLSGGGSGVVTVYVAPTSALSTYTSPFTCVTASPIFSPPTS